MSGIPVADVRGLLEAIQQLLDIPPSAPGHRQERLDLIVDRTAVLRGHLTYLVDQGGLTSPAGGIAIATSELTRSLERYPVDYPIREDGPLPSRAAQ